MATIAITEEKKKHVLRLIKSYKAIDSAILPYQEQKNCARNILKMTGFQTMRYHWSKKHITPSRHSWT